MSGQIDILVQPVDVVEETIIANLAKAIPNVLSGSTCTTSAEKMLVPRAAYNMNRDQYDSSLLLQMLASKADVVAGRIVLGICDVDLYVSHLNFVFGQAECPGRVAVISTHRLRQQFYGLPKNDALFLGRVLKEAVHEIGHCLGLRHCSRSGCVMFFSNSLRDTDRKGFLMCEGCTKRLRQSAQ